MIKLKSRNFLLMVCSIFFFGIIGFAIGTGILRILDGFISDENDEYIVNDILLSSSKIEVHGNGNFINSTPNIYGTSIENFNVQLSSIKDSVKYSIKLCNMGNEDFKIVNIEKGNVSCINNDGVIDCDKVEVIGYTEGADDDVFKRGKCIEFVVEAKYVDVSSRETVYLSVDKYLLKLEKN